jgi:photosystem II stability/assembly factor-like uncharacterized protein
MKIKLSTIVLLFTVVALKSQAQTYGSWQVIDGAGNFTEQLSSMAWPSLNSGFFLGNTLQITRTTDSGVDFTVLPFPDPIDTIHSGGNTYYNHHSAMQTVADMAWPSNNTGFVVGISGSDTFGHTAVPTVLATQDGGNTWNQYYPADTLELFSNIYFPSTTVGYGSASLIDGSEAFITKTTDGGKTWANVFHSDSLLFKGLNFINENNGIFFAQGISLHLGYTTDGGASFHLVSMGTDSAPNFLHWNNDSSWLVGSDSVYRSIDSGKTWKGVVAYDTAAGSASVGAFYDDSGFVFRANNLTVLMTTNAGVSWSSSVISNPDSLTPLSASMISPYLAYLLAFDNTQTGNALLKIEFEKQSGPPQGVNQGSSSTIPFAATYGNNEIVFTMAPASEARSIQVMDVLGRTCASLAIAPNAGSSQLGTTALRPGTYLAELSGSMVKFAIQ